LGLCVALGACGEKFVADAGTGGNGGTSSTAQAGVAAAGAPAGGSSGGRAGLGEAGANDTGGLPGHGGLGNAGAGTSAAGGGAAPVEPEIPQAGLLVWLRADRGVQQRDGHVQAWQDQSGNRNNASQAGVSLRPSYLATGFNGQPTLEFDGQGQFLKFADGFGDFSEGLTAVLVAKPTQSDCSSMVEFSNGSEVDDIAFSMWQNKWMYEVGESYIQTGSVDTERFSLYAVKHPPAGASALRIGGSVLDTDEIPLPVVPVSGIRVNNFVGHTLYGSCAYFEGQISEVILYSRSLEESELSAIEAYLNARWALGEQDAPTP